MTGTTTQTHVHTSAGPGIRDVDQAVRSVLAGFLRPALSPARPAGGGRPGVETFSGRLLSLKAIEGLREEVRVVEVAPGTVVTPLARDVLKRRGVEIRLVSRDAIEKLRNAGEWAFAVEEDSGSMRAVRRALLDAPEGWHELDGSLDAAAAWVAESAYRGALVVTGEAPVAVYRACQVPGVRAAAVCEVDAVDRAVRSLGLNLLVVEPSGKPIGLIRQLATTFRRGGGPTPPPWLV